MSDVEHLDTATSIKAVVAIGQQATHFFKTALQASNIGSTEIDGATLAWYFRLALLCGMTTESFLERFGFTSEHFARLVAGVAPPPKAFMCGEIISFIRASLEEPVAAAA